MKFMQLHLFFGVLFITFLLSSCDEYETCNSCSGSGAKISSKTCSDCDGDGEKRCYYETYYQYTGIAGFFGGTGKTYYNCNGGRLKTDSYDKFEKNDEVCPSCNGRGFHRCSDCSGSGSISVTNDCGLCNGSGQTLTKYGEFVN